MLRRLLAAIVAIAVCVLVVGVWETTRGGGMVANAGQLPRGGWVSDAGTGAVVAGAALRITTAGRPTTGPALASTVTKEDGSFELPTTGVRGVLEVAASGYATKRLVWPPTDIVATPIQLERSATVPVQVRNDRGTPISAVLAVTTFHPGNVISNAVRVQNGSAEAADLPSGPTMIAALAEGMAPAAATVRVEAGTRHSPLSMTLQKAGTIGGIVLDARGVRTPDAQVVAEYGPELTWSTALRNYIGRRAPAGRDLDFVLTNIVPATPVMLYAESGGRRSPLSTVVVSAGEERSDIVLTLE